MEMEGQKKRMMVAIDESEYGCYALEWALENLHDSIANKELLLFTVQPISDYNYLPASSYGSTPPELIGNIQEYKKKIALNLLNQAKDLCSKYGVHPCILDKSQFDKAKMGIAAETVTEVGDPKELIGEAVEKFKIQLLVLGSHSRGALKRVFLGSVSNHCVHNVKCPVLVVKKTE